MKTLEISQFGIEELTTQELLNNHGGGDNTSIGNIGSIVVADLVDLSGNSAFNGNNALFSGNSTDLSSTLNSVFSFMSDRS